MRGDVGVMGWGIRLRGDVVVKRIAWMVVRGFLCCLMDAKMREYLRGVLFFHSFSDSVRQLYSS